MHKMTVSGGSERRVRLVEREAIPFLTSISRVSHASRISSKSARLLHMKTARKSVEPRKHAPVPALTVSIEIDPLVEVVRRHVKLSPQVTRLIRGDFAKLFHVPTVRGNAKAAPDKHQVSTDSVLSTQEAADLVGVSRPYIVARIEAGDIPLHQQVGNQRRVLKSAVQAWHRREQTSRRRALGQLGADLDGEIFAG
jgi:excisionase family DNA binding protein